MMSEHIIQPLNETGKWHARDLTYFGGTWRQLSDLIPKFETADFRAGPEMPPNPYLRTVVRLPRTIAEQRVPVGVVSNTYSLALHHDVADKCFDGVKLAGVDPSELRCELGLTELGEWMNLRVYFPERFRFAPRMDDWLDLRLECFNSVDGSSRLVVVFGWLRFVCSNGLIIGKTRLELKDTHDRHLDIGRIPEMVENAMFLVKEDIARLQKWVETPLVKPQLVPWVNNTLAEAWGKKAASRVYHICDSGWDVDYDDAFAKAEPTEKPVRKTKQVPGSSSPAANLYDVSQAMSWVATKRKDAEERTNWQGNIARLVEQLAQAAS